MNILYLSDHLPSEDSFIGQDVRLMAKDYSVSYIAMVQSNNSGSIHYPTEYVPYPVNSFKSKLLWRLEKKDLYLNWYNKNFSSQLNLAIKKINPDIIHCQFAYEGLKYFDNINDKKTPVVINFRGYDASYKLKYTKYVEKMKKILLQKNVYSICVCEALLEMLKNKNIDFANKPHVLYTGVDIQKFNRTDYSNKNPLFVQVGAFNDKKGQLITVKAFQKFILETGNQNVKIQFVGEGKNLKKVKDYVANNKLKDRIIFLGRKTHKEIVQILQNATVFLHHSLIPENGDMEGIPNAIIEAMAMELPILSTYHSGIPEAVLHGTNGFLCKERDVNDYAKQMKEILKMGYFKENKKKISSKFEINSHIDQLKSIYQSVIN